MNIVTLDADRNKACDFRELFLRTSGETLKAANKRSASLEIAVFESPLPREFGKSRSN